MTAFWKNLHRLAQGQLFNGGYLTEETANPIQQRRAEEKDDARQRAPTAAAGALPTRLAGCR